MDIHVKTKLDTGKKIIILAAVLLALSSLSYFFVINPFFKKIGSYQKELVSEKKEAEKKFKKNVTIEGLSKDIKSTELQIQKLNSIYVNPNRELELVTNLEEVASKNKVKQDISFNRDSDKNAKNFKPYSLQIHTSGKFKDIVAYLSDLETRDYYININSLDFALSGSDLSSDCVMNFTANVYVNNLN